MSDGGTLYASHHPGPTPEEAQAIILSRARALWRKAQVIADADERRAAEQEAWRLAERSRTPGRYSVAAENDRLRLRRAMEAND